MKRGIIVLKNCMDCINFYVGKEPYCEAMCRKKKRQINLIEAEKCDELKEKLAKKLKK